MTATPLLTVAAAQITSPSTVDEGLRRVEATVDEVGASGVDLVVFPELTLTGYRLERLADSRNWIGVDDPRLDTLRDRCIAHEITAVVSTAYRARDGRRLLAALAVDPSGSLTVQAKQHLHRHERDLFEPGESMCHLTVRGWTVGLAVCFDAAVPRHAQQAADAGAEVYVASAYYSADQFERMDIHLAARAMDHRMFAVAANWSAQLDDSCGGSGVWGPDGARLARAGAGDDVVGAALDLASLTAWRLRDGGTVG